MAYAKIETSVTGHPKFLEAGSSACWLWVCGLLYAQTHLTDGFIPRVAVRSLSVPRSSVLVARLIRVGLWEEVEGGYRIHDYLDHNRSGAEIGAIREERKSAGRRGGKASVQAKRKQVASTPINPAYNVQRTDTDTAVRTPLTPLQAKARRTGTAGPVDAAFATFQAAYPEQGRKGGYLTQTAFVEAMQKAGAVETLLDALANHKLSAQWRDGKIPGMDTWLREERWLQRLEPPRVKHSWDNWRPAEES